MYIRDVMTAPVITVSSNTSVINARRIMKSHGFRRLPVVDNDRPVGIVTLDRLEKVASAGVGCDSMWELTYGLASLYRVKVKEVMRKNVVTVTPDTTVEEAVALAQSKRVGTLVVVENEKAVGIVSTNDFFYRILNKVLGIGESGTRIEVVNGGESKALAEIVSSINKYGLSIITLHIYGAGEGVGKNVIVHVDSGKAKQMVNVRRLIAELEGKGYSVKIRRRYEENRVEVVD